jgi:para-aminobenzoate synthetase component 1
MTSPPATTGANVAAHSRRWIAGHFFTPSGAAVAELAPGVSAEELLVRLAGRPHVLHLDSSLPDTADARPRLGRHSFLAADPIHSLVVPATAADDGAVPGGPPRAGPLVAEALGRVRSLLGDLACTTIPGLPPFQGGVAGLVAYECGLALAGVARPVAADPPVPLLSLHVYDVVVGFDHDAGRGWIISQGVPARGPAARRARAGDRLDAFLATLGDRDAPPPAPARPAPCPDPAGLVATRSPESHAALVARGIEYVRAGDVFQVNLARRLTLAGGVDPLALHRACRGVNPAPFAGFFAAGGATIVSNSPERLLQVERGTVRMHPIKGTRRMLAQPEADLFAGADLGGSEKDRAENVMIVDLVRNDLSRVCLPESVRVEALCRLERYQYVQHLVSVVAGRLRPGLTAVDALVAAIPGGSVTGAPKHRACEIIAELEGFGRGAYCGSLGWIGFDGNADFNLLIRTFTVGPQATSFAVGGGITARSDPAAEYAETLHKAEGMIRGLRAVHAAAAAAPAAGGGSRGAAP